MANKAERRTLPFLALALFVGVTACTAFNTRPVEEMRQPRYAYRNMILERNMADVLKGIYQHKESCNPAFNLRVEPTMRKRAYIYGAVMGHFGEATTVLIDLEENAAANTEVKSYVYHDAILSGKPSADFLLNMIVNPAQCWK